MGAGNLDDWREPPMRCGCYHAAVRSSDGREEVEKEDADADTASVPLVHARGRGSRGPCTAGPA